MVTHTECEFETVWTEWRALLVSCQDYAVLSGWRFLLTDFMRLNGPGGPAMAAAREKALPMALEYADRVQSCAAVEATDPPRLVAEFYACQRLVASEVRVHF